jgi:hypothetical protein
VGRRDCCANRWLIGQCQWFSNWALPRLSGQVIHHYRLAHWDLLERRSELENSNFSESVWEGWADPFYVGICLVFLVVCILSVKNGDWRTIGRVAVLVALGLLFLPGSTGAMPGK